MGSQSKEWNYARSRSEITCFGWKKIFFNSLLFHESTFGVCLPGDPVDLVKWLKAPFCPSQVEVRGTPCLGSTAYTDSLRTLACADWSVGPLSYFLLWLLENRSLSWGLVYPADTCKCLFSKCNYVTLHAFQSRPTYRKSHLTCIWLPMSEYKEVHFLERKFLDCLCLCVCWSEELTTTHGLIKNTQCVSQGLNCILTLIQFFNHRPLCCHVHGFSITNYCFFWNMPLVLSLSKYWCFLMGSFFVSLAGIAAESTVTHHSLKHFHCKIKYVLIDRISICKSKWIIFW